MKIGNNQLLKVCTVLSWIIFLGLCVEAGGYLFNILYTLFWNSHEAKFFWEKVDLSELLTFSKIWFLVLTILMTLIATLKALMFYALVDRLQFKKMSLDRPFNEETLRLLSKLTFYSFCIGILCHIAVKITIYLIDKGIHMPEIYYLNISGGDIWIFMGIILFIFSRIFKHGMELQYDNDLTV